MPTANSSRALEDEFCRALVKTGAVKFGLFTLAGGKLSPYYIDLRILPSFPDAFRTSMELLLRKAKSIEGIEKIAGIPTGGLAWASVLAFSISKPLVYTRKGIKLHGRERRVEGILTPGDRLLLVDDVTTTGKNILSALQSLRGEGGVVEDALVLVDREEGAQANLEKTGVRLHSIAKFSSVARKLLDMDAITKTQFEEVISQIETKE